MRGDRGARASMRRVMQAILKAELTVGETIALFDRQLDEPLSLKECRDVIVQLLPSLTRRQVHGLLNDLQSSLGSGHTDTVRLRRFLVVLSMDFAAPRDPSELWILPALAQIAQQLAPGRSLSDRYAVGAELMERFFSWDQDGDGLLSRQKLLSELSAEQARHETSPPLGLESSKRLEAVVEYLDVNGSGSISVFEFLQGFAHVLLDVESLGNIADAGAVASSAAAGLYSDVVSEIHALLLAHRATLLRGCRALDTTGQGALAREDFLAVVAALLHALRGAAVETLHPNLDQCEEQSQLEDLSEVLPAEVRYDELLAGLHIVETVPSSSPP